MAYSDIKNKQNGIVEQLREAILSGAIPAGTELTQSELAKSLGVSRMPVRETLLILVYTGLAERLPNNHVRVNDVAGQNLAEIFRLCASMECMVLGDIDGPLSHPERNVLSGEIPEELSIHRSIYGAAESAFIKRTLRTMVEIYVEYALRRPGYDQAAGAALLTLAIEAEDGDERKLLLDKYFENIERVFCK